jgi:Icc-related predicted phosphoesterase
VLDKKKSYEVFNELMIGQIKRWLNMAEERLKGTGVKVYMTGGNDDRFEIEPVLKSSSFVTDAEGEVLDIDPNHEMISTGYGNKTPWNCPRDVSEEELAKRAYSQADWMMKIRNARTMMIIGGFLILANAVWITLLGAPIIISSATKG